MKTLINPWKGLKPVRRWKAPDFEASENPNKSLEGIKTLIPFFRVLMFRAGENPNKSLEGIKTLKAELRSPGFPRVKTLINPWKGLKRETGRHPGRGPR